MFGGASKRNGLSPVFLLILVAFGSLGAILYTGASNSSILVLMFVVAGWTISLCLHEAAHALTAFRGGDRTVAVRGYLSLDPMSYASPGLTFGLPILYLLIGGIGLPGAAVYINHAALRTRWWDSAVSAAGPLANLLFLGVLAAPFAFGLPQRGGADAFWAGIGFLAYLQATAIVLNLLPIPGFDGFGIIRPHLPYDMQAQGDRIAQGTGFLLLALFFFQPFQTAIGNASVKLTDVAQIERYYVAKGYSMFRLRL
ncbi:MAG: site-2 protease family protein [Beijerinckiaceae bacterium]